MSEKRKPFVVMVKPAGSACNLACSYCYYLKKNTGSISPCPTVMEDDILEEFIKQYIEASPGPIVSFTWHGGEPALCGLDFYKKAVEYQKKYLPEGFSCWNSLQTNGVLLNDEWCKFLAENNFDVGLSIDGAKWIHDTYRKDLGGFGTYDRVFETALRLKKYGIMPDLLCTVTSDSAKEPLAVYRALKNIGSGWVQFIPIVRFDENGDVTSDSVGAKEYGEFLCKIFDEWVINDLGKTDVQFFAESARALSGADVSLCTMAETCGRVLIIERDGGVYSCDHFVDSEHYLGNIKTSSLEELIDSKFQEDFGKNKKENLPKKCLSCRARVICSGGCPKDRFVKTDEENKDIYYLCEGIERFFNYAEKPLLKIMEFKKNKVSPENMRAFFLKIAKEAWKGVTRNDPCPCGSGKKAKNCCWNNRP